MRARRRVLAAVVAVIPGLVIAGVVAGSGSRPEVVSASTGEQSLPTLPPTPLLCPTASPYPTPLPPLCPTPPVIPTVVPTAVPTAAVVIPALPAIPPAAVPGAPGSVPAGAGIPGGTPPGMLPGSSGGLFPGFSSSMSPAAAGAAAAATSPWVPMQVSGALVVADPFLAFQVQQVLQHPVAQQRPTLLHFAPTNASQLLAGPGLFGGSPAGPMLLAIALAAAVLVGVVGVVRLRRSPRLRAVIVIGTAAMLAPLGAAAAGASVASQRAAAVAEATAVATLSGVESVSHVAAGPAAAVAPRASAPAATPAPQLSPAWLTLVSIEEAIAKDHSQLQESENAIAAYNAMIAAAQPAAAAPTDGALPSLPAAAPAVPSLPAVPAQVPGADLSAPVAAVPDTASTGSIDAAAPSDGLLRPNVMGVVTSQLGALVSQHDAQAAQYEGDLQREYDFFVATAQSTKQQADLVQSAALAQPDAAKAVAYNINLVYTQLAQEEAIRAAEAAAAARNPGIVPAPYIPSGPITFHAPASGVVSQGFGPTSWSMEPPLRYNGVFYSHFHTGLDIAAAMGTPLGSAADGVVILATSSRNGSGQYTGYGNYVVIAHGNGFVSLYGHMEQLYVRAGQVVKQGQVIGLLGSTGWSTGPHVHFEIRNNGVFVDPAPYIAGQIVR